MLERVLFLFYEFTLSVSRAQPCLPESIGILWGLDDLLQEVAKAEGMFGDVGPEIRVAFDYNISSVPSKCLPAMEHRLF